MVTASVKVQTDPKLGPCLDMADTAYDLATRNAVMVDLHAFHRTETKPAETQRVRRKLDLSANSRGAFGQLLGTLSKAKREDKLRNASESVGAPFGGARAQCSQPSTILPGSEEAVAGKEAHGEAQ